MYYVCHKYRDLCSIRIIVYKLYVQKGYKNNITKHNSVKQKFITAMTYNQ